MQVLAGGWVLTMDEGWHAYPHGYVVFDERGIRHVGDTLPASYAAVPRTDCTGTLVLPGFCNTHTHLSMVPFRTLGDDCRNRLRTFLMPLEDAAMTEDLAVVSAKVAMAELLLSGTTSAVDMYYFEWAVARAAAAMGFRLWAGETLLGRRDCDAGSFEEGLDRVRRTIDACGESPLLTPVVAPHAPYSLSLDQLCRARAFAKERGLRWTMHLSEMPFEIEEIRKAHGCTPVAWMDRAGLLDADLLAVHLITLTPEDEDLIAARGVPMSHCPGSNLKAGKGTCPVLDLMEKGVTCTLGTDGPSSGNTLDSFMQMRLAAIVQKTMRRDRGVMAARDVLAMATRNAGKALGAPIGMLKPGMQADVTVLSLDRPNLRPCYDPYAAVVYGAQTSDVRDVYVAGVRRVAGGRLVDVDLAALYGSLRDASVPFAREASRFTAGTAARIS